MVWYSRIVRTGSPARSASSSTVSSSPRWRGRWDQPWTVSADYRYSKYRDNDGRTPPLSTTSWRCCGSGTPRSTRRCPPPLTGGFWAELLSFRLAGPPPGWAGHLVARVMPEAGTAAKETAFQSEVPAQGFPTHRSSPRGGPADGLAAGRSW